MFRRGRPGRPLLAGAVIVGASRSAARREVGIQSQYAAESQRAAERSQREEDERVARAIERNKRGEQDRDRSTALAIDEAIARERSRGRSPLPDGMQGQNGGSRLHSNDISYEGHGQGAPPAYPTKNVNMKDADYMSEMEGRKCSSCGCARTWQDRYCAACGCKLAVVVVDDQENVGGAVAHNSFV